MNKTQNKILIKDVSGFEPYEDWWSNEVTIKEIVVDGVVVDVYKDEILNVKKIKWLDSPHYVLTSFMDVLNIEYRADSDELEDESDYTKYLIDLLNKYGFEVLFEAHDELIKYESKGIVSTINPSFKAISEWNDFIFASDTRNYELIYIFKDINAEDILNYITFSKSTNNFLSDKVLNNVINTYKDSLSFMEMLYDKLPPQT